MVYIPTQDQISVIPDFNSFFRAPRDTYILVSQIANSARLNAGIEDRAYIWKTIRAIAASPWNKSHIKYAVTGYENYNIQGPQYNQKYGIEPLAQPNSGNEYPVLWIPDPDNALDPETIYPANVNLTTLETQREIPLSVIEEIADVSRPVIILEPTTTEAAEIALSISDLPTQSEAAVIQEAAAIATDAQNILADPSASEAEKIAAIEAIAELARDAGAMDEQMEAEKDTAISIIEAQAQEKTGAQATPYISTLNTGGSSGLEALGPLMLSYLVASIAG